MLVELHPADSHDDLRYVVVVAFDQDRIVLSRKHGHDTWETPGGHLEPGEGPLAAARRELYEESGVRPRALYPAFDFTVDGIASRAFVAEVGQWDPLPDSEMAETRGFDDLPDQLTYPDIAPIVVAAARRAVKIRSLPLVGLLLDLDRTLLDHDAAAASAVLAWAATLPQWHGDQAESVDRWRELEARHFSEYQRGECDFPEQRRRRVRGFLPQFAKLDDAEADRLSARYLEHYQNGWTAFADARPLIEHALSVGLAVGVLTNGDQDQQGRKLHRLGLDLPGVRLFASSALGVAKPHPEAFRLACAGLGTPPAQTLMVGDDVDTDIVGARAAGLPAWHLARETARPNSLSTLAELHGLRAWPTPGHRAAPAEHLRPR